MKNRPVSMQRSALLERLRLFREAVTVAELATAVQLHPNTVREHLEALVARGLAVREPGAAQGRGRPAWRYRAAAEAEPDGDLAEYATLVRVLAQRLSELSPDPPGDAVRAGESWGRAIAEPPEPASGQQPELAARQQVVAVLDDLGFDPTADPAVREVQLRRCPFVAAARPAPEIICNVHLGIARGALARLGSDPDQARLQPFAGAGVCRLRFGDPPPASGS